MSESVKSRSRRDDDAFIAPALPALGTTAVRHLVFVLGDQLNRNATAFDGFDHKRDAVFMAEVDAEAQYAWSTKQRIAVFLTAMRKFALSLVREGISLYYTPLLDSENTHDLIGELSRAVLTLKPERVILSMPGEWRLLQALRNFAIVPIEIRTDDHFMCTTEQFAKYVGLRRQIRMESFYRLMRAQWNLLMAGTDPVGGTWNFDTENRKSFDAKGPRNVPPRSARHIDGITRTVLDMVNERFADHPGTLSEFDWPLTREEALDAMHEFIAQRLPHFGDHQDAMWTNEPWLFHSQLSVALNLKLLDPREVVRHAESAYREGRAPLAAVEGFIRQILGWREYVRGIYWHYMPDYLGRNALEAQMHLPQFYWTAQVPMVCLRETLAQTLALGYAHHIQRLMVTGLYALLLGVAPREVHAWYLAVYVDAVEWVELPNTLGMSQYGDGGLMGSKPYVATGKYIARMSNYCKHCRFEPSKSVGDDACPFTTLYWDFLSRHEKRLETHPRMALQVKNLKRMDTAQRSAIAERAQWLRDHDGVPI